MLLFNLKDLTYFMAIQNLFQQKYFTKWVKTAPFFARGGSENSVDTRNDSVVMHSAVINSRKFKCEMKL